MDGVVLVTLQMLPAGLMVRICKDPNVIETPTSPEQKTQSRVLKSR